MSFCLTVNVPADAVKVKQQQNCLQAVQHRHRDAFDAVGGQPFVDFEDNHGRNHYRQEADQANDEVGSQFEDDEVPGFFFLFHFSHLYKVLSPVNSGIGG